VRLLIMLVRYWGRVQGLVGRDGKTRLSNYALTLMVIAYLQQIPCPILHSVQELLTITDVDIHPSSFCSFLLAKQDKLPPLVKNTDSLTDLLMGFFNHYHGYDYGKNVISIFLGRTIDREQLILGNNYRSTKPVCLQDPFELNFNICRNMNTKALGVMKCSFYDAFKKTRKLVSTEECDSLAALLLIPSPLPSPLQDCTGCDPSHPTQP
jgi:DNA polymerase sigma